MYPCAHAGNLTQSILTVSLSLIRLSDNYLSVQTSRGPKDARESTWSADLQGFRDAATSPPPMPVLPSLAWIQSRLPSWDRALYLCDVYVERARWLTTAVTPEQLRDEMLPIIYQQAPPDPTFDYFGPHPLALLYYTFALGALLDPAQPAYNAEAAAYSELGRASLSLERIFEKPSVLTVQCLHFTYLFSMMSGGNSTNTFVSAEQARCHHYQASRLAYQVRGAYLSCMVQVTYPFARSDFVSLI